MRILNQEITKVEKKKWVDINKMEDVNEKAKNCLMILKGIQEVEGMPATESEKIVPVCGFLKAQYNEAIGKNYFRLSIDKKRNLRTIWNVCVSH